MNEHREKLTARPQPKLELQLEDGDGASTLRVILSEIQSADNVRSDEILPNRSLVQCNVEL